VVACKHYWEAVGMTPRSFDGAWPEDARTGNEFVFMNSDGEMFVHAARKIPDEEFLMSGDAVLYELDEPIPEDSGIKIYDTFASLDNDQNFATVFGLNPQGRIYCRIFISTDASRQDTEIPTGGFPPQQGSIWWRAFEDRANKVSTVFPSLVEERKLPGGDLENEPTLFASIGRFSGPDENDENEIIWTENTYSDFYRVWPGDSGSPMWIYSKTQGTMPYMGFGGRYADASGPPDILKVERLNNEYLSNFNEANGTDYSIKYEIVNDAIRELTVPPTIEPLVCKTQKGMHSRQLICEVTATGSNGEVVTKRSLPLVAEAPQIPVTFKDEIEIRSTTTGNIQRGVPNFFDLSTTLIDKISSKNDNQYIYIMLKTGNDLLLSGSPQILDIKSNDMFTPLNRFVSGSVTIDHPSGESVSAPIIPDPYDNIWEPKGACEAFVIPESWSDLEDETVDVTIQLTNESGSDTITKTVDFVKGAVPTFEFLDFTPPNTESSTGHVRFRVTGDEPPTISVLAWVRENDEQGALAGFLNVTAIDNDETDAIFTLPIAYNGIPGTQIPCNPHLGQRLVLGVILTNTFGSLRLDPVSTGQDAGPTVEVTIIDENVCS